MEINFSQLSLKIIIGFFLLFFITKMLGKTTIKQITPFDFVSSIVLSEILGNALYDEKANLFFITYSVFLWGGLMILMEKILLKFKGLRGFLEGNPSIIIRNGVIDKQQLRKNSMNLNQLLTLLRQNGIFSVRDVEYVILESDGSISVLPKYKNQNVTVQDMQLPEKPVYLPTTLILDGEIIYDNLIELGFTKSWLMNQITTQGYNSSRDILYADWLESEGIFILPY